MERSVCEYCHGYTKIDDFGNCIACGAPKRPQEYHPPYIEASPLSNPNLRTRFYYEDYSNPAPGWSNAMNYYYGNTCVNNFDTSVTIQNSVSTVVSVTPYSVWGKP